ncbi:MAG: hypothetical protein ACYC2H_05785 [Thermoplasmatota archaeon]
MALETYSAMQAPEACTKNGTFDRDEMMSNWWVNDPDIATYLQGLGAPAHFAAIDYETQGAAPARLDKWTWRQEGFEDSWVTYEGHEQVMSSIPFTARVFWFSDTLLGVMDFTEDGDYDFGAVPQGQMAPPSLYAVSGTRTPYSGSSGGIYYEVELGAALQFFGDFQCKNPG